jgi:heterodisulfide reductase subunit A
MSKSKVIIIGAGPAGLEAAYQLDNYGYSVSLIEQKAEVGGNVRNCVKLFPDFTDAGVVNKELADKIKHGSIELKTGVSVNQLYAEDNQWIVKSDDNTTQKADAVLLATGFKTFNASRKEELGYGIYSNVITSVEFEKMYKTGKILTSEGKIPEKIAFINCVGSRDEQVGNHYCSRICCINAVKLSIMFKELVPTADAYCFYMDMRMTGQFYEELYRTSQEKYGVNYIRGRVSETAATIDNRIQIKAEDTLVGLPVRLTVDLVVLMVGIQPSDSTEKLSEQAGVNGQYGFAKSLGLFGSDNYSVKEGLFLAGTCKKPLTLIETITDARAAALQIMTYLKEKA